MKTESLHEQRSDPIVGTADEKARQRCVCRGLGYLSWGRSIKLNRTRRAGEERVEMMDGMGFAEPADTGFNSAKGTNHFCPPPRQYHWRGESSFACKMGMGLFERIQGNHL